MSIQLNLFAVDNYPEVVHLLRRIERLTKLSDLCFVFPYLKKDERYYPRIRRGDRTLRLHRIVYATLVGPTLAKDVHHTCENKSCLNPRHMKAISRGDHMRIHVYDNIMKRDQRRRNASKS